MNNESTELEIIENPSIQLKRTMLNYLRNWYWFVISILAFLSLAYLYLRYATPIYEISSALLIKQEKGENGGGSGMDILNELNILGSNNNTKNEIQILSSRTLMDSVVTQLQLTTTYNLIGNVKRGELYNLSPIKVDTIYLKYSAYKDNDLTINYENPTEFLLTDKYGKENYSYGEAVIRPYGEFMINQVSKFDTSKWDHIGLVFSQLNTVTGAYLSNLKVTQADDEADVVELVLLEPVPQKGTDILNRLIYLYQQEAINDKNEIAQQTINFIDTQLKFISTDLSSAENNIEQYEQKNEITDINEESDLLLNNISDYNKQLSDLEIKGNILKLIQNYLNDQSKADSLVPSTLGIDDPTLIELIGNFNRAQLQRERLIKSTGPENPMIGQINSQLSQLKSNILETINNLLKGIAIGAKELQANNSTFNEKIKSAPLKEKELIQITRQKEIKQNLYIYLLQKREEASLSLAATISNSRIIDSAYSSNQPVKPVRLLIYVVALLFGAFFPGSIIYFKETFSTKINSIRDIELQTNISILGSVGKNYSKEELVVKDKSKSAISEQFRLIRTNLEFLTLAKSKSKGTKIMITSSMSGEGKSFFTLNLGSGIALSGKKTLLMEVDLRKPKLSEKLGISNDKGLSNFVVGSLKIEDLIKPTKINENLFLISSGPIPPNPSELLLNERIIQLFEYLENHFDYILLDTAPIGVVADALILSKFVDTTLYIVRHKYTYKQQVKMVDQLHNEGKLNHIAIVYNSVKWDNESYGYGYGYGYGYYEE